MWTSQVDSRRMLLLSQDIGEAFLLLSVFVFFWDSRDANEAGAIAVIVPFELLGLQKCVPISSRLDKGKVARSEALKDVCYF
jgi:hypothetical protein